jgi:hypothetical protein
MPVPASINDLSTTAGSNSPAGSETPTEGDNYIRTHASFIALLRDKLNGTSDTGTVKNATFSGTMAGAASWVGLQTFAGGIAGSNFAGTTYTPTLTSVSNVSSTTAYPCQYMRVGTSVTVSGHLTVDPTTDGSAVVVGISLPIASNFAEIYQCAGSAHGFDGSDVGRSGGISADITNNRAQLDWVEVNGASSNLWTFTFTYTIV